MKFLRIYINSTLNGDKGGCGIRGGRKGSFLPYSPIADILQFSIYYLSNLKKSNKVNYPND